KILSQCIAGSSHVRIGHPCQDACKAASAAVGAESVLLVACADGAGSARFADVGAARACQVVLEIAKSDLRDGQTVAGIDRDAVCYWLDAARQELQREAERRQATPRDLACTLLLGIVGEQAAAFAQIGDGAIVTRYGHEYR